MSGRLAGTYRSSGSVGLWAALRRRLPGLIPLLRKCHCLAIPTASSVEQWPPKLNWHVRFLLNKQPTST